MSNRRVWQCDRCGFQMVERQCKVICPNCGARWDCSDVTIWVGDGRNPYTARPYQAIDQSALSRQWPQAPTADELAYDALGAWLLWEEAELRGCAAIFPAPGLPGVGELTGAVQAEACRRGAAAQLLDAVVNDIEPDAVQNLSYAVDSLDSQEALVLQEYGFGVGHEEWQMAGDVPPAQDKAPLPRGYDVRTLPRAQAIELFLELYDESFAPTAWYQPYSHDEVNGELRGARDLLFLFHDGEAVGFAWLRDRGEEGEIEPIGIVPGEQGHGAGRTLLNLALQRLRKRGHRRVRIGAWRQNKAAIHLYESAGLRPVARRYYLLYKISR